MSEGQLAIELAEIEKDKNLTATEKKTYLSIYGAELERQRSDKHISIQKSKIQDLRMKVIDDIINIYTNLDEEKRNLADGILFDLGLAASTVNTFRIDDVVAEHEIVSDSLTGTVTVYLDDNIHKELEELNNMHRNFIRSIDRKYMKLEDKLSSILDPEVFHFISQENPELYKEQKEFDDMFVKENKKIDELDIGAKEKAMLRNILLETIRYGKSYGTMYEQFDNKSQYVDQRKAKIQPFQAIGDA